MSEALEKVRSIKYLPVFTWSDVLAPFIDPRPPLEAGKPELRRYRKSYMLKDEPVGELSYIASVNQ